VDVRPGPVPAGTDPTHFALHDFVVSPAAVRIEVARVDIVQGDAMGAQCQNAVLRKGGVSSEIGAPLRMRTSIPRGSFLDVKRRHRRARYGRAPASREHRRGPL